MVVDVGDGWRCKRGIVKETRRERGNLISVVLGWYMDDDSLVFTVVSSKRRSETIDRVTRADTICRDM
jgi:hypothetical protein